MQQILGTVSSLGSGGSLKEALGIPQKDEAAHAPLWTPQYGDYAESSVSNCHSSVVSSKIVADPEAPSVSAQKFPVGTVIEYNSASQGCWIPAKVLSWNADGTCDLDCKPRISITKIRPLPPVAPPEFEPKSLVEYYSESRQGWISARVLEFNPANGTYNLDCKPNVHPSKLRPAPPSRGPSSARSGMGFKNRFDPIQEQAAGQGDEEGDAAGGSLRTAAVVPNEQTGGASSSNSGPQPEAIGTSPVVQSLSQDRTSIGSTTRKPRGTPAIPVHSSGNLAQMEPKTLSRQSGNSKSSRGNGQTLLPPLPRGEAVKPQEQPLQLVTVTKVNGGKWRFEVNDEAAAVLESYGQRQVAICTVCGPYRTGKSYLMNLLLGRIQQGKAHFTVGSTTKACTEGLWMWGAGDTTGDGTSIIFMDCEGFGSTEADRTRDSKLMALCIMISSVFMLNTKGVLNEGLFNALALVCHLAEHVEERGSETSKPILLWLLRDFVLDLRDESGKPLSPDEYLENALRAQPLAGPNRERSQAAFEVRECLMKFFPSRHCATLVQPVIEEEDLRNLAQLPYEKLRQEFRGVFESVQDQLLRLAQVSPKAIAGKPVGAASVVGLLRKLVEALNSEKSLNIRTAWDQVQMSACASLASEMRRAAVMQLQKIKDGAPLPLPGTQILPVRDDVFMRALKEGHRAMKEEWLLRAVGDEPVRQRYWKELKEGLSGEERALEQINVKLGEDQLQGACTDWLNWLGQEEEVSQQDPRSEALMLLLDRGMPAQPATRVAKEALLAARMARIRWDGNQRALKSELALLNDDLAVKVAAAEAASRLNESQLDQEREVGCLRGQVEGLKNQAREQIAREKALRDEAVEAEERARKEERQHTETRRKCEELEQLVSDLEDQVSDLRRELHEAQLNDDEVSVGEARSHKSGKTRLRKPKCACNVM